MALQYFYYTVLPGMWLAWGAYWLIRSRRVKSTARRESTRSRLSYYVPTLLAAALVYVRGFPVGPLGPLDERFWPLDAWRVWGAVATVLTFVGLSFAMRARVHLGRNWSAVAAVKEGHELIISGPYRVARHPIYTGLLIAFVGVAVINGEWRAVLGVVVMVWAFWRKLRIEERLMLEQFGSEYQAYRQRVAALIPFVL